MGVAQSAYEPRLWTITANSQTGICASFKTWFKSEDAIHIFTVPVYNKTKEQTPTC